MRPGAGPVRAPAGRLAPLALLLLLATGLPGAVRSDDLAAARALMAEAAAALAAAGPGGAKDASAARAALGRATAAEEAALLALRAAHGRLLAEERRLRDGLGAEREATLGLVAALQTLAGAPRAALLARPGGPLDAARAAALMAGIAPELEQRLIRLQVDLDRVRAAAARTREAAAEAEAALVRLAALRARSAPETAGEAAALGARAVDLGRLAGEIAALAPARPGAPTETFAKGRLIAPVTGRLIAAFGAPDPWGRPGQGWSFRAPAFAEVRAPAAGTLRFAGPLIDYAEVVVLEPEPGYLIVLAGLGRVDRRAGEAVEAGERLGDLGGDVPAGAEFLLEGQDGHGQIGDATLYLELRRAGEAIDPDGWFATEMSEARE